MTALKRFSHFPVEIEMISGSAPPDRPGTSSAGQRREAWTCSSAPTSSWARTSGSTIWGLLVVDEEQRFGVGHKEKLKKLTSQVDVLTLSATPFPGP